MGERLTAALAGAVLGVAALFPGHAGAQQGEPRPLGATRVAAQIGAGVIAMPVGFIVGGKATEWAAERLGVRDPRASRIALVGAWAGAALATSGASAAVGARGPGVGSYGAALAGTLAGGVGSYLLVRLNDRTGDGPRPPCRRLCTFSAIAVFALPSVGATVAYGSSRRSVR